MLKTSESRRRFLIVDDKPFIRQVIQGILRSAKISDAPQYAGSGEEAIRVLRTHGSAIDCILCDWNMAPVDGLQLLRAIRSGEVPGCRADICFVMITGQSEPDVVNLAL